MADDNVLGIQATINSSEIDKGVNDYIRKITEMEKATDQAVGAMSGRFKSFNDEILAIASSVEKSRIELEKTLKLSSPQTIEINTNAASSIGSTKDSTSQISSGSTARERGEAKERQKELNKTIKQERAALEEAKLARDKAAESVKRYTKELEEAVKWQKENAEFDTNNIGSESVEKATKRLADAKKQLEEAETAIEGIDSGLDVLYENSEAYANSTKKGTQAQKENETILVKMLGGSKKYKEIMSLLPAQIKEAANSINNMTKAAKIFLGTPLGVILGALILAFQAMRTYLNGTSEGQMKLAKITGTVSGVMKALKDIVIGVGKALFDAFSNPKKMAENFGKAIKENVINRIKAVGDMGSALGKILNGAFKLDKEQMLQGAKELGESFLQWNTGIDNLAQKTINAGEKVVQSTKNIASNIAKSGAESGKIAVDKKTLDIEMQEWEKAKHKLEAKKQQFRGQVSNTSLSTNERKAAAAEYEKILEQEYQMELGFINRKIDLQKRQNQLGNGHTTLEDEPALRELEAQREEVIANYQRGLAERQDTNGAIANAEREALREIGEMEAELLLQNQEREISILKEGHEKKMKEIQAERDAELQKIKELEEKFKKQNRRAGVETGEDGLTDKQRTMTSAAREGIEKKYTKQTEDLLKEELDSVLTYQQKRAKIEEEYARKRADMQKLIAEGKATKENVAEVDRQEEEALKAVDEEFASRSEEYQAWMDTITSLTIKQLEKALETANAELETLKSDPNADQNAIAVAQAKVNNLNTQIKKTKSKGSVEKRDIDKWKDLGEVLGDTAKEFEQLGDTIGGTTGEIISSLGTTFTSTVTLMNNITQFADICEKGIKNTSGTAVSAIKAVEAASVILAIISAAIQVIQKIASVAKKIHDAEYEKTIEDNQNKIENLKKSYEELEEAVDAAYGQRAVQALKEMNDNLERQNTLIQEQRQAEEDKKETDESVLEGYDDAMDENRKQMEANTKAMEEAIFGSSIQSAIENFADAYADAVADNMDLNESAAEQAKKAMKDMVMQSIKEYVAGSEKMEKIRAKMEALYADGMFDESDQKTITNLYKELNKEIDEKFAWAEDILSDSESSSSTGSKRGIATASQESVDENNGRLMSIQMSMDMLRQDCSQQTILQSLISADTTAIRESITRQNQYISEIVDIQYESVGYLKNIDMSTRQLYEMNERLGQIEANTRNL